MRELLKSNYNAYLGVTTFMGIWVLLLIYSVFKKTRDIAKGKVKNLVVVGISSVLVSAWVYFFIYLNLYPIALANYEYKNDLTKVITGTVSSIEQKGKDRVELVIDNSKYIIVHSSRNPVVDIDRNVTEGDTVSVRIGVKSKFVFCINELDVN